jgi:hypothetical protein
MKLSQLRSLCDKAIEKYGDMNVGAYDKDYAYGVEGEDDLRDFKIRILSSTGSLPSEAIDDNEGASETPSSYYACIFYED